MKGSKRSFFLRNKLLREVFCNYTKKYGVN